MTPTHRANVEHCRVLALLASCADSCTEALLLAHGFAVELLRGDARGRDGGVRQELAAGIGRVLINAQIAAPLRLSKKRHSPLFSIRVLFHLEATPAQTHG